MSTIKDPVRLQVHNLEEDRIYIKDVIYEREELEQWIHHSVKMMDAQFHKWTILEVED